jgi:flagellar biosynthesis protein FliR
MDLQLLTISTVITFLLILIRISGMLVSSPVFSGNGIPAQVKVGIAVTLSILLFPLHADAPGYHVPHDLIAFSVMAAQEFVIGLLIGFVAELVFAAIRMSGEYIGVQMGLSVSGVLDPISGTQTPLVGQFYFIFAFLLFLSLNIHHALIVAVDRSFKWVPLGEGIRNVALLTERFVTLGGEMFVIALLIGVPVMGILLATEAALGFVAKVMPQMNIFIVGLPLKIGLGLLVVLISLPYSAKFFADLYAAMIQHLLGLYQGM